MKLSVVEWAKDEVMLAIAKAKHSDGYFEGIEDCYKSALAAYSALFEGPGEGATGNSFQVTASILKRLLDLKPLTPIEDVPEAWLMVTEDDYVVEFQSRRMPALFKRIDKKTGEVTFCDHDAVICYDDAGIPYHNGFIVRRVLEKYPIQMPYQAENKYKVKVSDFSTTGEPGEFDTIFVKSVTLPDGKTETLNWYYKETKNGFEPIEEKEYLGRYEAYLHCSTLREKAKRAAERR